MSVHTPHTMDELAATPFDLVVTLSPDARDAVDGGGLDLRRREHWPMPDPTLVEANREAILSAYRTLRDSLQMRVRERLEPLVAGGSQTG
jgi:protein-tyrosine-phosphatase